MADSGQEFSGRSVDEAIAEGLAKLGLREDQVEIEILSRGSRGIFGLGSEPARVRITRRAITTPTASPTQPATEPQTAQPATPQTASSQAAPATPSAASSEAVAATPAAEPTAERGRARVSNLLDEDSDEYVESDSSGSAETISDEELSTMAVELLTQLVKKMGFDAQVTAAWHEADDNGERYLLLDIHWQDVSPLIGRRGETLASIQYLVRLMINQRIKRWKNIVVDVEQYKERRVTQLTQLAKRMAEQVTQSGRAVSLEPMPANERRIVHLALRDHPSVYTQSSGEGDRRKVHIVSRT
jgi:spoIIIJ-associated protein